MYRNWTHTTRATQDANRVDLAKQVASTTRRRAWRREVGAWLQSVGRRLAGDGMPRIDVVDSLR